MTNYGQILITSPRFSTNQMLDGKTNFIIYIAKLPVLTQNVGVLLKVTRPVEDCINDYHSTKHLTYEQFLYFLTHEVLSEVDDGSTPYGNLKVYHDILEKNFWLLGRAAVIERECSIFTDECVFKLFRIFCLLADRTPSRKGLIQVSLNIGEVKEVTQALIESLGREWDDMDFDNLAAVIPTFSMPIFLTFLEGRYAQEVEAPALKRAVDEIYDKYVEQILKRGKVYQRAWWAPLWVARELEVRPWVMSASWRSNTARKAATKMVLGKGEIGLNHSATVHAIPDEPGARTCRFTLCTAANKLVQLAAPDHKSKTEWLRALDSAIANSDEPLPHQWMLSTLRKAERASDEAREVAERIRRASQADIIENTQAELVAERLARQEAEVASAEEATALAQEAQRVQELQQLKHTLEQMLEEESQAKRDEEIVRSLQARLLSEEWEKREELERIQEEQKRMLEEEKSKRLTFQKIQEEKDSQLKGT
ncbi:unnamed protein product, partial [Meganyctiphanes norvegica]